MRKQQTASVTDTDSRAAAKAILSFLKTRKRRSVSRKNRLFPSFRRTKPLLDLCDRHLPHVDPLLHRQCRGDTACLADADTDGHDAIVGVRHVGPADVSAGEKQSVHDFRYETAIGDRIALDLREMVLASGFVQSGSGQIVYVEIEAGVAHHPVHEHTGSENILLMRVYRPLKWRVSRTPIMDPALMI